MHHLTVLRDFAGFKRGDHIEDDAEVARILASEHAVHVVKVLADAKPEAPASFSPPALPMAELQRDSL